MESFELSDHPNRDIQSNALIQNVRSLGLASCYEARLASTMLIRAMDREMARRPATTKCGRMARAEERESTRSRSLPGPSGAQRPRFVQVVARSPLRTEPA